MDLKNMPILPLKGVTVFPDMVISFPIAREISINAIDAAHDNEDMIFAVPQINADEEEPNIDGFLGIGVVCKIKQVLKLPVNITHIIVEGINRAYAKNIVKENGYFKADAENIYEDNNDNNFDDSNVNSVTAKALMRLASEEFEKYTKANSSNPNNDVMLTLVSAKTPGKLADVISAGINVNNALKIKLLSTIQPLERLNIVVETLISEIEILNIKNEIAQKVKSNLDDTQKEYYLREQFKIIGDKLGDKDGVKGIKEDFIKRANDKKLPEYAYKTVIDECERMVKIPVSSPEFNLARTYIDCILKLPWNEKTEENKDIKLAKKILDEDHYGLKSVKERILQFIAVKINSKKPNASIICLVGPPGVGNTSIAKSIARATGRKYVRMSLGGVKDESEIRGHRRTYVGAMWGRILSAMKDAKTTNPLILLDEVDKLGTSFNGDPSSALLEVLDPEQNNTFVDHYIDMPYDLSDVLFICTANDINKIPVPLKDRMEIIQLSGYMPEEKKNIAVKYLYPKQLEAAGLDKSQLFISENAIDKIIELYTREAGVRQLERTISEICRKAVVDILSKRKKRIMVYDRNISKFIGPEKFSRIKANKEPLVGVARGLAWTSVGGDTLEIEANIMKGSGKIELTGNMGDVMKESAKAGISYIRSNSDRFKIESDFYKNTDIHIHIPEGAVPKDGPSAGITMATAVLSALLKTPVKNNVAMTGEITITGRVLPIGGLKEKVIAAKQANIDTVLIPKENLPQIDEIPKSVKNGIKFICVSHIDDVINNAILEGERVWK